MDYKTQNCEIHIGEKIRFEKPFSIYSFRIYGDPVPQGRPRVTWLAKHKGIVYDPKESKKWKKEVAHQVMLHCHRPKELLIGPLEVQMIFYLKKPKKPKAEQHITRPDCTNLAKGVEDALEGIIYKNDSQIWKLEVTKRYVDEIFPPGTIITVKESQWAENIKATSAHKPAW